LPELPSIAPDARRAAPLLQARGLAGRRGERLLFEGLDLTLWPGEVVWLRGRNGRGKTTLLRLLAGLSAPAAGQVEVEGRPLARAGSEGLRPMLYIAHANALKDDLTAAEALRFLARLSGQAPDEGQIAQALGRLGVGSRAAALVRTLSQGQRRRVALARLALPGAAPLWLLDEPFDALDDRGIGVLNTLLFEHTRRRGAVLLTSHQALTLADPAPRELRLEAPAAAQGDGR
jgi:heme exporter protein A